MSAHLMTQLADLGRADRRLVGGKAAALGELLQAKLAVPPGFVLTTEASQICMTPLLSEKILAAFVDLHVERVAVRSSAVAEDGQDASWAGQLESYLNVTRDTLLVAIQKCWASIASERAVAYADYRGMTQAERRVAVVVQTMIDSDISGVMFTANPITRSSDQWMIEAVRGLGDYLVQGLVTPESLVVDAANGAVLSRQPSQQRRQLVYRAGGNRENAVPEVLIGQPIVDRALLARLLDAGQAIARYFGTPQDIEWAYDGQLWIVQSRPITTP